MTYEEFKRELYRNVLQQEDARGKTIRLLQSRMACTDAESIHMAKLINFARYGEEDLAVHEDMLCVSWGRGGLINMKHWQIRPLYERFLKEGWQSVLPQIAVNLQEAGTAGEKRYFGTVSYEQCRDRHIVRPLNYHYNRGGLENCIYWRFGDIALVLYDLLFETDEECMTMKLNRGMTEQWGISDHVLLSNALLHTRAKMPPRLFYGEDIRYGYEKGDGIFMPDDGPVSIRLNPGDESEGIHGYRLTTAQWLNGAVSLFYPCVKERLAQMMGGDYFVGFTSIHEAVIHPVRHQILGEMKAAIQHINAVFDEREMLTNQVYRYSRVRKELMEV